MTDQRTIKEIRRLMYEGTSGPLITADEEHIKAKAKSVVSSLNGTRLIDRGKWDKLCECSDLFYKPRKCTWKSSDEAKKMGHSLFFGVMIATEGGASGGVAGFLSKIGFVKREGVRIIGLKRGIEIVSNFFIMIFAEVFSSGKCAVVPGRSYEHFTVIAIAGAGNDRKVTCDEITQMLEGAQTKGSIVEVLSKEAFDLPRGFCIEEIAITAAINYVIAF